VGSVIQSQAEALKTWEQKIQENIVLKEYILRKIKREETKYEGKIMIFEQAGDVHKEDIEELKEAFHAMKVRNTKIVEELEKEKVLMEETLEEIHGKLNTLKSERVKT